MNEYYLNMENPIFKPGSGNQVVDQDPDPYLNVGTTLR